ncbi:MAG: DUF4332 domain-containing protein [Anaerolineaceae bacterium]|nr:DUF4332 domain-containing protein [Anaerolineaceae bacterium]
MIKHQIFNKLHLYTKCYNLCKKKEQDMTKVVDIEGVGPVFAKKLQEVGIASVEALLKAGATPEGRKEISAKIGIDHHKILSWVNFADLYRIKGVGSEYSELLEQAGVDTIVELSKRVPANLHAKIAEVNAEKKLVRREPTLKEVHSWVEQAKQLDRVIKY